MYEPSAIIFWGPENDWYLTATNSRVCAITVQRPLATTFPPPHPQGQNQAVIHDIKPAGPSQTFFFSSSPLPRAFPQLPPKIYTIPSPIFLPAVASHSLKLILPSFPSPYTYTNTESYAYIFTYTHPYYPSPCSSSWFLFFESKGMRKPCCDKRDMNKGAWSKQEDQKLIDYISKHGEGGWRTLPQAAGARCFLDHGIPRSRELIHIDKIVLPYTKLFEN